jgi:hypothetical protein
VKVKVNNLPGTWVEEGDAGDTLASGQAVIGSGPLTQINGTIPDGWDHDLYKIAVTDYTKFSAQVTAPEGGDSRMALFDAQGLGLVFNDDMSDGATLSSMDYATSKLPSANGLYYLGIMTKAEMPASTIGGTNAYIWTGGNPTAQIRPDGPGATSTLVGFGGYGGSLANYTLALTGTAFVTEVPAVIHMQIRMSDSKVIISWPVGSAADGFILQEADQVASSANWRPASGIPVVSGSEQALTITPTGTAKFYRLAHP